MKQTKLDTWLKKNHYRMELVRTVVPCIVLCLQFFILVHLLKG